MSTKWTRIDRRFILEDEDSVVRHCEKGTSGWRLDVADELPMPFLRELRKQVKADVSPRMRRCSARSGRTRATRSMDRCAPTSWAIAGQRDELSARDASSRFFNGTEGTPAVARELFAQNYSQAVPFMR